MTHAHKFKRRLSTAMLGGARRRWAVLGAAVLGAAVLGAAVLGAAMLASCLRPFDPCPCAQGSCQLEVNRCIMLTDKPTDAMHGCVIYEDDGRLYCSNPGGHPGDPLYESPMFSTSIVDHMTSSFSWFRCWDVGEPHSDGMLWYSTNGDDTHRDGWLPGDKVNAPKEFQVNPATFGFQRCPPSASAPR